MLGYFDDNNKEYVITSPRTPYPWINYLGNKDFFSLISNTAGGYSFYKDAKFRRITRYRYNNVPVDTGGKYFYIKDGDCVWSPSWKPVKLDLEKYECRHGLGYTRIIAEMNDVRCEVTFFVPLDQPLELHSLKLTNLSSSKKSLTLFSFLEWCLWNAEDDMSNFQRNFSTGEVEVRGGTIIHKTEFRERRNHFAYYGTNEVIAGFDTDRDIFLGAGNGFECPDSVFKLGSQQSIAHGWSPIASHSIEIELETHETKNINFVLGYEELQEDEKWEAADAGRMEQVAGELEGQNQIERNGTINEKKLNAKRALALVEKFTQQQTVEQELNKIKKYWESSLSAFQLQSHDSRLDRMINIWNQYQCMVTFRFSRSASFFESGIGRGMGFRDSNQDLLGVMHIIPEEAKQRIRDIAATQFEDGSAYHQYQPLTKKGNADIGGNFNDDPLWLILSVSAYLKETGDFEFLEEMIPFENSDTKKGTLFEHLQASFNHVLNNLGPHELPLIGRADWNDCLNLNCYSKDPNESFQTTENEAGKIAESVMIAAMFVYFGREYRDLCLATDRLTQAEKADVEIAKMEAAIEQYGWDGEWFLRAYDSTGNKVGSSENDEGKIFIESQGFGVMAEVGKQSGKASKAMASVKAFLDCDYGLVLCYPAFKQYHLNLGEISTYPPGYKENGGIFCHNNPWIMIAETKLKNGNQAYEYYKKISPGFLQDKIKLHKTEPYVYSQMIAGKEAPVPGEAKNSWLTGTAAWNYHAITEHILGIKPTLNGLMIDPCLPDELKEVAINRQYRGANYKISIVREESSDTDKPYILKLDGTILNGKVLPIGKAGATYNVQIQLSKKEEKNFNKMENVYQAV